MPTSQESGAASRAAVRTTDRVAANSAAPSRMRITRGTNATWATAEPLDSDANAPRTASTHTVTSHPERKTAVHHHPATRAGALTLARLSARHTPKRIVATIAGLVTTPIIPAELKASAS